jgi:DNA polymerase III delta subunit
MIAEYRVVVVREAEGLAGSPKARTALLDVVASPPPGLALILSATVPQGSKAKFYKELAKKAQSVEFQPFTPDDVPGWLLERARTVHGKEFDVDAAQALGAAIGTNLGILAKELEKLADFVHGDRVALKDVEAAGTRLPSQDRWRWFDLVGERRLQDALNGVGVLMAQGESGVGLVIGLTTHLLRVGVVSEHGTAALEAVLPRHQKWLAGRLAGQGRKWTAAEVDAALEGLLSDGSPGCRVSRRLGTGLLVALIMLPAVVSAQEHTSLEGVDDLARMGRTEEARAALVAWWESDRQEASRRDVQRALWLRGSLTVDPDLAALDFRRLVIEYPGGPFSDRALLRLAQAAHASGDGDAARGHIVSLTRDYPTSPVRREGEAWLDDAGPAPPPPLRVAEVDSIEGMAPPDPAPEPPPEAEPDPRRFSVQLGAFADHDRARALVRRANDAGLDGRMVRVEGTRLVHVRVGLFDSVGPASELLRRVGGMGFVAALVRDANKEERILR